MIKFTFKAEHSQLLGLLLILLLLLFLFLHVDSVDGLCFGLSEACGNVVFLIEVLKEQLDTRGRRVCGRSYNFSNHFNILAANDEDATRDVAKEVLDVDALDGILHHEIT